MAATIRGQTYAVTAAHVLAAGGMRLKRRWFQLGDRLHPIQRASVHPTLDVAFFPVPSGTTLPTLATAPPVLCAEVVIYGLGNPSIQALRSTVCSIEGQKMMFSAAVASGQSGSAVLDSTGAWTGYLLVQERNADSSRTRSSVEGSQIMQACVALGQALEDALGSVARVGIAHLVGATPDAVEHLFDACEDRDASPAAPGARRGESTSTDPGAGAGSACGAYGAGAGGAAGAGGVGSEGRGAGGGGGGGGVGD